LFCSKTDAMAAKVIHRRYLHLLMKPGATVSLRYVKSDGSIISLDSWAVTSFHCAGNTVNVMNPLNHEVRKLRRIRIIELNGVEVII